jgi:hypothetical protein
MKPGAVKIILIAFFAAFTNAACAQQPVPIKPRILISTDIGGTDPDDNQSITHFLMYSYLFKTEGLISSPSYGKGNKSELLRMIDLYEKDLPKLKAHIKNYPSPNSLRGICKQGRLGAAPYKGYLTATEGSDWIIKCARKKSKQPLWVLVWGGLDDLAQALHDAPEIQSKIKVYWIGGPNKKWSANSYAYIVANFPKLWFIECNSSYYGFFSDKNVPDSVNDKNYFDNYIKSAGSLGADYKNYYKGNVKMGDTPSLLYMMGGDPNNPFKESWGGSFEQFSHSPRIVFTRNTTLADTVTVCSVVEFRFKGPVVHIPEDSSAFTMTVKARIGEQKWAGYYLGNGEYAIRYCPKQSETLSYKITSSIPDFAAQSGQLVVDNNWPGKNRTTDYLLGLNWYTDRGDTALFDGVLQGAKTISKWRNEILIDWAKHWSYLYESN